MSGKGNFWTRAPAKINWTLEVLGKREDGYHEIRSVMQTLSLSDVLELRFAPEFSLTVEGPEAAGVTDDETNLVAKAARAFPREMAARPIAFRLTKIVPPAAGLGGGSSDAAAALQLLQRVWKPRPAKGRTDMRMVAARLGSDVPFFLAGGTQLVSGRGEIHEAILLSRGTHLVVLTPPLTVARKTARLYAELNPDHYTDGEATRRLATKLRRGGSPAADDYVNVFDAVADRVFEGLPAYRRLVERLTGSRAMLAGAGPSLFAVVEKPMGWQGRWPESGSSALMGARVWNTYPASPGYGTGVIASTFPDSWRTYAAPADADRLKRITQL